MGPLKEATASLLGLPVPRNPLAESSPQRVHTAILGKIVNCGVLTDHDKGLESEMRSYLRHLKRLDGKPCGTEQGQLPCQLTDYHTLIVRMYVELRNQALFHRAHTTNERPHPDCFIHEKELSHFFQTSTQN